jgi:hypothetical protein
MRHGTFWIASVAVTLMAAACDNASSITSPDGASTRPAFDLESVVEDAASTTTALDVPWAVVETNPCNGDEVATQGKTHFVFKSSFDASGGTHNTFDVSSSGGGVGMPSMVNYRVSDRTTTSTQDPDGMQSSYKEEHQLVMAAPQPALTYVRHVLIKLTFNAAGVLTVTIDDLFTRCAGETQLDL